MMYTSQVEGGRGGGGHGRRRAGKVKRKEGGRDSPEVHTGKRKEEGKEEEFA